ncbi:MAG: hypothetical protein Q8L56_17245 [Rhodocyclaceae bacterium]|nr:hypothetical protein [Rhodocyclaceae bacterium]
MIYTAELFDTWFDSLCDARGKAAIRVRMRRADKSTQTKDIKKALKLARES